MNINLTEEEQWLILCALTMYSRVKPDKIHEIAKLHRKIIAYFNNKVV